MSESLRILSIMIGDNRTRVIQKEFRKIINALNDFDYAVTGTVALGEYIERPRASSNIDFILDFEGKFSDVKTALRDNGLTPIDKSRNQFVIQSKANCQWDIDFLFTAGDELGRNAINTANRVNFFGIENVRLVNSVCLAEMLASSASQQHEIDLHDLLYSTALEVNNLLARMEGHSRLHARNTILQVMDKIKRSGMDKNGYTETWEEYMNRRAMMKQQSIMPKKN